MGWARLDDGFWMHPKIARAGNEYAGIFARILSYCGSFETDGAIPYEVALTIAGTKKKVETMIEKGLLHRYPWSEAPTKDDLFVQDWSDYNPTHDELESDRKRRRDAGRKGGLARGRNLRANS